MADRDDDQLTSHVFYSFCSWYDMVVLKGDKVKNSKNAEKMPHGGDPRYNAVAYTTQLKSVSVFSFGKQILRTEKQ
jgi:hypothetical protein